MKKLKGLLLLATLLLTVLSYAQPPGGGGGGGRGGQQGEKQGPPPIPTSKEITKMVSELASEISLNELQEAGVLNLYTEHFETVKSKTADGAKPKREEMDALNKTLETKVKELLDDEQKVGYDAYLKEQKEKRQKK